MKFLVLLFMLTFGFHAFAQQDVNKKISELTERINILESQTLSDCRLNYVYYTTVTNVCPDKTVAKEAFLLHTDGPIQLKCYYYQLECRRKGTFVTLPISSEE